MSRGCRSLPNIGKINKSDFVKQNTALFQGAVGSARPPHPTQKLKLCDFKNKKNRLETISLQPVFTLQRLL